MPRRRQPNLRRALFWYLPLGVTLAAIGVFGTGLFLFATGRTGTPVSLAPAPIRREAPPAGQWSAVVLGDSLARGTGDSTGLGIGGRLQAELERRGVRMAVPVNLAVNGAKTTDLEAQLQGRSIRTVIASANVVIVSIGGNDLWGGAGWRGVAPIAAEGAMTGVLGRVESILRTVRAASPQARIYVIGLYNPFALQPGGARLTPLVKMWNARLQAATEGDPRITIVETADLFAWRDRLSFDRFHPGNEGYELIARRIADSF